jgi:peptidoglycan hydrolase-like protein with peptidoglycan-binding domain
MDFKKLIQVADVFGTETKKLAELKEGELADRIAQDLGWDKEDADEIEQSVDATGNDPAELANIMTDGPAQPVSDPDEQEPTDTQSFIANEPAQDTRPSSDSPAPPARPGEDSAPQIDADADSFLQSPEWNEPDNIEFEFNAGGRDYEIIYNPRRNTMKMEASGQNGGQGGYASAYNGIAIVDGKLVGGDYGTPLGPVEERPAFAEALQDNMMQELGDVVSQQSQAPAQADTPTAGPDDGTRGGQEPNADAPQTDAELDADSADNAPTAGPDDGTRAGQEPNAAPQTDAELDADSADSAPTAGPDDGTRAGQEPNAAPQTDAELDADSADNAPQGDALAGRLDTETPSLLDAYNDGGRRAMDNVRDLQTALSRLGFDPNGIDGKYGRGTYAAVQEFQRQNGLTVDGEAGPTTMAKLQELLNGGAAQEQPQGDSAADVAQDDAARTNAPQTDAENDADSADNATPAQPAQTNAELDADSADTATPQQIDPEALAAVRRVGNPSRVGTDAGDGMVWIIGNGNFFTRTRPNNPKVAAQKAAAASLKTQQNNSKEFDMKKFIKESKELDECGPEMSMPRQEGNPVTMSVTLNASGEQNVQDLIRMMQLAGAKDAAPVADMHTGPVDKHDDMVNMMRMMDQPEESVEEEWDNAPEEDYKDHKYMTKDLSGGLNREKKAYKAAQPGDNAMAVESIKDQLIQALEGKYANDAQRKAVHAAKDKKKK